LRAGGYTLLQAFVQSGSLLGTVLTQALAAIIRPLSALNPFIGPDASDWTMADQENDGFRKRIDHVAQDDLLSRCIDGVERFVEY
jgi:hypothetical protein